MSGTSAGAAQRKRCKCGAFAHLGPCPSPAGRKLREGITRQRASRDLWIRLWEKIDVRGPDECWEWQGGRNRGGYGHIYDSTGDVRFLTHRLVAEADEGEVVMHSCDNPPCCNPAHLSRKTHAENMRDMVQKGRQAKGERHPNAKLTVEQVIAIKNDPRSSLKVAPDYNVSSATIRKIRRGERWT